MQSEQLKREIVSDLGRFSHDPYRFVLWAYPWGVPGTPLANESGPDEWQRDQLVSIGASLKADPFKIIQDVTASGHGIGKSAEVSWLIHWAIMTFEDTRGVVTANTDTQLRTKTWPELQKWHGMLQFDILKEMFKCEATSIHSTEPEHERNWRIDAIPWSAQNTEAFAGLHNAGKRVIYLFDEGSAIIDPIWEVASGGMTDAETEIIWAVFGNPTRNTGRFKEAVAGRHKGQWTSRQIDSRKVKRTNKQLLDSWIEAYGEDSDFVRVRVKGQFPRASTLQLIGTDLVAQARTRDVECLPTDPVIFGLDTARFGDDQSVLAIRHGRDARTRPWTRWAGANSMQIAGDVNDLMRRWKPDAIFIDAGGPNAGGVIDRLRQLNPDYDGIFEIHFSSSAKGMEAHWNGEQRVRVANKRAQMWVNTKTWLARGALPDEQEIEDELTGVEYGYNADNAILLEKKEHMKARGLPSPDNGDALALTFAEHVEPRRLPNYLNPENYRPAKAFDRYEELPGFGREMGDYDRYNE